MIRIASALALFAALAVGYYTVPCNAAPAGAAKHSPEIVMYVMPGCGYCERARTYLEQRGLSWQEKDITTSKAANSEFQQKGGVGTPLILVDGSVVQGFSAARMDAVLANATP
jgi:glutaredoxin